MKDALGNTITDKSLLCWHPDVSQLTHGVIVNCVHVTDGGLSLGDTKQRSPAMLVIQIPIPVNMDSGGEPQVGDFICVVNPQAEAAIDRMLEGQRRQ